jgi:hypothetical protein
MYKLRNGYNGTIANGGTENDKTATPDTDRKGSKRAQELRQVGLNRAGNPEYPDHKPTSGFKRPEKRTKF